MLLRFETTATQKRLTSKMEAKFRTHFFAPCKNCTFWEIKGRVATKRNSNVSTNKTLKFTFFTEIEAAEEVIRRIAGH